jgi:peptide/nickel transport system ATP-binding protein
MSTVPEVLSSAGPGDSRGVRSRELVLQVLGLEVRYGSGPRAVRALRGVDLDVRRHGVVGLAGESGSGKSTLAYAVTRLLRPPGEITSGRVTFFDRDGTPTDVLALDDEQLRRWRWEHVSIVFQAAMAALNPVSRLRRQLLDVLEAHRPLMSASERESRVEALMELVDLPTRRLDAYPHQLSGGQRQRAMIAMAMALDPECVILDEPTTALDVVVQREILSRLQDLQEQLGFAMVFITHDLSLLLEIADTIAIFYAGKVVEQAPAERILTAPLHPYTKGLIRSFPSLVGERKELVGIPGSPPDLRATLAGCAFHPRCPFSEDRCRAETPMLEPVGPDASVACLRWAELAGSGAAGGPGGSPSERGR